MIYGEKLEIVIVDFLARNSYIEILDYGKLPKTS